MWNKIKNIFKGTNIEFWIALYFFISSLVGLYREDYFFASIDMIIFWVVVTTSSVKKDLELIKQKLERQ